MEKYLERCERKNEREDGIALWVMERGIKGERDKY